MMNRTKIITLICCIVLLCGCNNKKCIKSHQETGTCIIPHCVFAGKSPVCINQFYTCEQTICDEYEVEDNE